MSMVRSYKAGFTLTELMVVVTVVSILAAVIFNVTVSSKLEARDSKRIEIMKTLEHMFELYKIEYGRMPGCNHAIIIETRVGAPADFQTYSGPEDCVDIDALNAFFDTQASGEFTDPGGAGDPDYSFVYDSVHACGGSFPSPQTILFTKMELPENANAADVCPQGADNEGNYNSGNPYVIELQ